MRLFISYAHADRNKVTALITVLQRGGQEIWLDDDLRAGEIWREALRKAIDAADGIVLAITPAWTRSRWCRWEFITARELGKKVIPVLLIKTKLPKSIKKYQYANFIDGFNDAQQVQKFLNDLLVHATEIEISATSDMPKSELEQAIDLALHLGSVTNSTINSEQNLTTASAGNQGIAIGGISDSVVTITISDKTVHIHGERQHNWTLPVMLGLLLVLLGVVAIIVTALPDSLLYSVGFALASDTPNPTATLTPLPTPTLTTTPAPLPVNAFNVVVAGFGYQQLDGSLVQNRVADDLSDIVFDAIKQLPQTQINYSLGWRATGVGHIIDADPKKREEAAARIANTLNADVVIYGIVSTDGFFEIFQPEFYVSAAFTVIEPELLGAAQLGNPVEFLRDSDDNFSAATDLQRRLTILKYFIQGLSSYILGDFEASAGSFENALEYGSDGLDVLYIFAGNAAARDSEPSRALQYYDEALQERPNYARALIGRGSVLYRMALNAADQSLPPYDSDQLLGATLTCRDADVPLSQTPQRLAEQALRCYQEANAADDKQLTADIDVKSAFGVGEVSIWLSINNYGDYWDEAQTELQTVIDLYDTSSPERQLRIRAIAAHAYALLGLRLISIDDANVASVEQAADDYQNAITLLGGDINHSYNRQWIDLYSQQYSALEDRLTNHSTNVLIEPSRTPTSAPAVLDSTTPMAILPTSEVGLRG